MQNFKEKMNYEELEIVDIDGKTLKSIVLNLGDGAFKSFPADPANPEYAAFLESLNDDTETE
jgi:hypothetical protein